MEYHPSGIFLSHIGAFVFGTAVMSRVLQLDLDRLQSIAFLGVIHGVVEVIETKHHGFH